MFQLSKRGSDHDDLYKRLGAPEPKAREPQLAAVDELEEPVNDEFEDLKRGYSISREYEIYLETEKRYL